MACLHEAGRYVALGGSGRSLVLAWERIAFAAERWMRVSGFGKAA